MLTSLQPTLTNYHETYRYYSAYVVEHNTETTKWLHIGITHLGQIHLYTCSGDTPDKIAIADQIKSKIS